MLNAKTLIDSYYKHREKILYLIFGFITTVIYLGSYKVFLFIDIHYVISTNIAFIFAVLFAYFTNKHIVFKKGHNFKREITLFFLARIITQLLNNVGLIFMVEILFMDEFLSQVIISVLVIILNYVFSKYAIFI